MQAKLKQTKTQKTLSRIKILKILYTANSTVQAVEKQYNYMKGLVERLLNAWWTHWPNTVLLPLSPRSIWKEEDRCSLPDFGPSQRMGWQMLSYSSSVGRNTSLSNKEDWQSQSPVYLYKKASCFFNSWRQYS